MKLSKKQKYVYKVKILNNISNKIEVGILLF